MTHDRLFTLRLPAEQREGLEKLSGQANQSIASLVRVAISDLLSEPFDILKFTREKRK